MKISLTDRYSITTDEYNYILQRRRVSSSKCDTLGNFPNLFTLVHYLLNYEILISHATEIVEMKKVMENIQNEMVAYLNHFRVRLEPRLECD